MAENEIKNMKITVLRYRPEQDEKPWDQTFEVPYHHGTSLLEALFYIKDNLEPSLSFRWSCRMAICGSCGALSGTSTSGSAPWNPWSISI